MKQRMREKEGQTDRQNDWLTERKKESILLLQL
jgi:hypothetical protein